jgi:hypothetical protein
MRPPTIAELATLLVSSQRTYRRAWPSCAAGMSWRSFNIFPAVTAYRSVAVSKRR